MSVFQTCFFSWSIIHLLSYNQLIRLGKTESINTFHKLQLQIFCHFLIKEMIYQWSTFELLKVILNHSFNCITVSAQAQPAFPMRLFQGTRDEENGVTAFLLQLMESFLSGHLLLFWWQVEVLLYLVIYGAFPANGSYNLGFLPFNTFYRSTEMFFSTSHSKRHKLLLPLFDYY